MYSEDNKKARFLPGDQDPRLRRTEELLLSEETRTDISIRLAKEFGVTTRTAWNWMRKITERWVEEGVQVSIQRRRMRVVQLEKIARDAQKARNYSAAIAAFKLISDIEGNNAPQQIEVTQPDRVDPLSLTPQEREARINELLAQRDEERERN